MMVWAAAGLLTLLALLVLWAGLRLGRGRRGVRNARLAVYRDRLRELDGERAAGTLDDARYAEARRELEDAAAVDLRGAEGARTPRGQGAALAIVAVVVPVLAFGLYAHLGSHDEAGTAAAPVPEVQVPPEVAAMVARLTERMERTPDDLQGWMMLGRSRVQLRQFDAAVAAWRQAHRLAPDDPSVAANLGEALVLADAAALDGEGGELFERALEVDPAHAKALWYGGMAAARRGDRTLAAERWRRLLSLDLPPELVPVVQGRLDALERE